MKALATLSLSILLLALVACAQQDDTMAVDMQKLQRDVMARQELLLAIHLDLDAAAREISDAQVNAAEGNCSGAEFHATEAYRQLRDADEAILDLGRDLQALFNLDSK